MSSKILMSFLVPVIFFHKMEIITSKTPVSSVCQELYRMMTVRCIFAETTTPERIRPRIEIWPVKGHFLSNSISDVVEILGGLTDISSFNCFFRSFKPETDVFVPSF